MIRNRAPIWSATLPWPMLFDGADMAAGVEHLSPRDIVGRAPVLDIVKKMLVLRLVRRPGLDEHERHGAITGVFKMQIDWIPLALCSVRPSQGRTLAVMQVSGGSQSFNAVNQLRVLGRWMRMITIPNQSSVAKAFQEFDETDRMRPSPFYDRVVDVMEELMKFTLLTRGACAALTDRHSERKKTAAQFSARVNLRAI